MGKQIVLSAQISSLPSLFHLGTHLMVHGGCSHECLGNNVVPGIKSGASTMERIPQACEPSPSPRLLGLNLSPMSLLLPSWVSLYWTSLDLALSSSQVNCFGGIFQTSMTQDVTWGMDLQRVPCLLLAMPQVCMCGTKISPYL